MTEVSSVWLKKHKHSRINVIEVLANIANQLDVCSWKRSNDIYTGYVARYIL